MSEFNPKQIPHFDEYSKETQEKLLIIPSYILQVANAKEHIKAAESGSYGSFGRAFVGTEQFLIALMSLELLRICWEIVMSETRIPMIHPAIRIVRDIEQHIVDIRIADDLSQWAPAVKSAECG